MNRRTKHITVFAALVVLAIAAALLLPFNRPQPADDMSVNKRMMQIESFGVSSDSADVDTSARGTVFVRGDEGAADHIRIVASIQVDPDDWGGVAFYIPHGWHITDIASSYPEAAANDPQGDVVATWTTGSEDTEWRGWVEIGRDRSYRPTGGGAGTIVIDMAADRPGDMQQDDVAIGVEVGSSTRDGVTAMGTDSIVIPVISGTS